MQVRGVMMVKDIYEMAKEIGVKKENVEAGLKKNSEETKKSITAAYNYVKNKGKKK